MNFRVHMDYNLNRNCMQEIKVTDHHTAESLQHHVLSKNDIYILDAGYGKAKTYVYATVLNKSDVIMRITPNHLKVYSDEKTPIDLHMRLNKTKEKIFEIFCYIKYENCMYPIRIIASKIPEDKMQAVIKRKKRKAQKSQTKTRAKTLVYAQWTIIATSLISEFSKEEILNIYRSRWQVELLFKRIKQKLSAHKIRPSTKKYAIALIHLWLITWALTEREAYLTERYLIQSNIDVERLSIWDLCSYFYIRITTIIESGWALLTEPSGYEILTKYLLRHKSKRRSQNFDFRSYFTNILVCNP